jgi:hypothetical protein
MNSNDSVLAHLALEINGGGARVRLTLRISDLWLTGIAVSEDDWVDALEQMMNPENAELIIGLIREVIRDKDDPEEWLEFGRLVREVPDPEPIYLHLIETSILSPKGVSRPFNGVFRCGFYEVSAWMAESVETESGA